MCYLLLIIIHDNQVNQNGQYNYTNLPTPIISNGKL